MFERLLNEGSAPILERMLQFTSARQKLISENVVNYDTPDYKQKDLSLEKFQQMLSERVEQREDSRPGEVGFGDVASDLEDPLQGQLFHDGSTHSMEQLMSDQAKNALMHNFIIELLKKQFSTMELALKDHPE